MVKTTSSGGGEINSISMILDSLPPIVPSIGVGAPSRVSAAEISATTTATTTTTSAPSAGVATASTTTASVVVANPPPPPPPPPYMRLGNRTIVTSSTTRSWSWKAFSSTARSDDAQFHHWVPSSVEYADYPYARFDVHLDPLIYSNEEYEQYLEMDHNIVMEEEKEENSVVVKNDDGEEEKNKTSRDLRTLHNTNKQQRSQSQPLQQKHLVHSKVYPWTKSETDSLLDLARAYDLRWPVIIDKWKSQFANVPSCKLRQIEDLEYGKEFRCLLVMVSLALQLMEEFLLILLSSSCDASFSSIFDGDWLCKGKKVPRFWQSAFLLFAFTRMDGDGDDGDDILD